MEKLWCNDGFEAKKVPLEQEKQKEDEAWYVSVKKFLDWRKLEEESEYIEIPTDACFDEAYGEWEGILVEKSNDKYSKYLNLTNKELFNFIHKWGVIDWKIFANLSSEDKEKVNYIFVNGNNNQKEHLAGIRAEEKRRTMYDDDNMIAWK